MSAPPSAVADTATRTLECECAVAFLTAGSAFEHLSNLILDIHANVHNENIDYDDMQSVIAHTGQQMIHFDTKLKAINSVSTRRVQRAIARDDRRDGLDSKSDSRYYDDDFEDDEEFEEDAGAFSDDDSAQKSKPNREAQKPKSQRKQQFGATATQSGLPAKKVEIRSLDNFDFDTEFIDTPMVDQSGHH